MDNRIGAQLYTLREYCKTAKDFADTLKKVKKIGYQTVQVSAIGSDITPNEIKQAAQDAQVEIICTHKSYDDYIKDVDKMIDFHKTIGCNIAGLGAAPKSLRESKQGLFDFIKDFNKISNELYKNGITFGYHNHGFEFAKLDGKYVIDYLIEETDPDSFKFILDVYWLAFAGIDPVKYINKLGKRAAVIHFKDLMAQSDNTVTMCEIGNGNLDWDSIIDACKKSGCLAAMVEQDKCLGGKPFESMEMSYKYLSKKGFC